MMNMYRIQSGLVKIVVSLHRRKTNMKKQCIVVKRNGKNETEEDGEYMLSLSLEFVKKYDLQIHILLLLDMIMT